MEPLTLILKDLKTFDYMDAPVLFWDKNEICQYANASAFQLLGKNSDEVLGKTHLKTLLGETNYHDNYDSIQSGLNGNKEYFDVTLPLLNDIIKEASIAVLPYTVNNATVGFFLHVTEISSIRPTKISGSLVGVNDEILRTFIDSSPMPVWIADSDNVIQYLNEAYRKVKPFVKVGLSLTEVFPKSLAEGYQASNRKILATKQVITSIEDAVDPAGRLRTFKKIKFPIFYKNKLMIGGYAIDITEQVSITEHQK